MTPSLADQIAELKREIAMRRNVYPRWVQQRKMTQPQADHRIACLQATLDGLVATEVIDLFGLQA